MTWYDPHKHHHRGDPETARLAAVAAGSRVSEACRKILDYLREIYPDGLTDEEGIERLRMFSFPKRRCDLYKHLGFLEDSGLRRPSQRGRPMVVWRIKRQSALPFTEKP